AFGTQFAKDGDFEELHGFTGKEYDPDIGLYYFNARWYDPDLGRFISEDPARDPNNPNLYSYCGNNPLSRIDPTGQFWWFALLGGLDAYLCGGDFMQGFVMGAVTGAIGAGVGNVLKGTALGSALGGVNSFGFNVASGAIAGGITGELFGEGFEKGAVYGAISAAISYGVDARFGEYASRGTYNRLVVAGLKGGLNALARGGDFVEAFAYGAAYGLVAQKIPASVPPAANHSQQSSLTLSDAGEINEHVYRGIVDDKPIGAGEWKCFDIQKVGGSRVGIYTRVNSDGVREITVAVKGMNPFSIRDWGQNILQVLGISSDMLKTIEYAIDIVQLYPDAIFTFIGHSKGGAEAAAMAVATNKDAILFNPARPNYGAYGVPISSYEGTMTSYVVRGEILNNAIFFLPKPTENVEYLPRQYWNPFANHGMPAVNKAINEYLKEGNR
ncbi:MAG: hypothetical protein GX075_03060, partial [Firmicutes bacterium]|nr:hypothetical protein [Bacillota bacterium]